MKMEEIAEDDVPRVAWRTVKILAYFENKVTPQIFAKIFDNDERIGMHMMEKFVVECRRDFLVFVNRLDRASQDKLICAIFEKGCYGWMYDGSANLIYSA